MECSVADLGLAQQLYLEGLPKYHVFIKNVLRPVLRSCVGRACRSVRRGFSFREKCVGSQDVCGRQQSCQEPATSADFRICAIGFGCASSGIAVVLPLIVAIVFVMSVIVVMFLIVFVAVVASAGHNDLIRYTSAGGGCRGHNGDASHTTLSKPQPSAAAATTTAAAAVAVAVAVATTTAAAAAT